MKEPGYLVLSLLVLAGIALIPTRQESRLADGRFGVIEAEVLVLRDKAGKPRIRAASDVDTCAIALLDKAGMPRATIGIDGGGNGRIELLDQAGKSRALLYTNSTLAAIDFRSGHDVVFLGSSADGVSRLTFGSMNAPRVIPPIVVDPARAPQAPVLIEQGPWVSLTGGHPFRGLHVTAESGESMVVGIERTAGPSLRMLEKSGNVSFQAP